MGSTHGVIRTVAASQRSTWRRFVNVLPERGAGGAADGVAVGEQPVEEHAGVGADRDVGGDVSAEVLRVDVDVDQDVVLGNGIVGGRDFAVTNPDGEDEVDFLERRLGGAGALLAVTPADGQRVMVGKRALAADRRGDGSLQELGDGGQRGARRRRSPGPA